MVVNHKNDKIQIGDLMAGEVFIYSNNDHYVVVDEETKGEKVSVFNLDKNTVCKLPAKDFVDKLDASLNIK